MANETGVRRSTGTRANGMWPRPRLFTVDEYDRLAKAGIFCADERVELLDGVIFEMSPINPPHAACLRRLNETLVQAVGARGIVDGQDPVVLPPASKPQPDLAVLKRRADYYATAHPQPEDILLLIEISDTTYSFDRNRKIPRYAAAGIREAWQFDLKRDRVLVYRYPQDGRYTEMTEHHRGDTLSLLAFPDLVLRVADLLP